MDYALEPKKSIVSRLNKAEGNQITKIKQKISSEIILQKNKADSERHQKMMNKGLVH